jgi:hypothetical protein
MIEIDIIEIRFKNPYRIQVAFVKTEINFQVF